MTERARHERVLITGVTGFIGSRVAARWVSRDAEVRGLVRQPVDIPGVDAVVGDMHDTASLARAVEDVDVVIHAAADFGSEIGPARRVHEDGTRALAEVAGAGLGVVILRPPNVLGAHPRSEFVEVLATRVRDGTIGYALDGANTWPYVHVEDLVDAIGAAADLPIEPGRAFTIVAGHTTWRAFLEHYAEWFGVEVAQREPRSVYDHFRGRFATGRAEAELGFAPQRSYADALAETRRVLEGRGIVPSPGDA
jgi:nucleoside-diphosphate-sugar epimerase